MLRLSHYIQFAINSIGTNFKIYLLRSVQLSLISCIIICFWSVKTSAVSHGKQRRFKCTWMYKNTYTIFFCNKISTSNDLRSSLLGNFSESSLFFFFFKFSVTFSTNENPYWSFQFICSLFLYWLLQIDWVQRTA